MQKYIIPTFLALALIIVSTVPGFKSRLLNTMGIDTRTIATSDIAKVVRPITITLVGDIMMDRGVRRSVEKNFDGSYEALFVHTDYLKQSDITFGNLEGPAGMTGHNVGSRFSFRMDPKVLPALRGTGFDIVSFANNHVGDYTMAAFKETLANLTANHIRYAGAGYSYPEVITPTIINVRGTRIGFLAATDVGPNGLKATDKSAGILLASNPNLLEIIKNAKLTVDILVVSYHWGNEYSPANKRQEKIAHSSIDAGADIIIGHHPHVMERVEIYKDKPIFYSLGNFIFDQSFSSHTMQGMVAHISIDPETYAITTTEKVSAQSRQFVPQPLIPFDTSMLVTKTFTP